MDPDEFLAAHRRMHTRAARVRHSTVAILCMGLAILVVVAALALVKP